MMKRIFFAVMTVAVAVLVGSFVPMDTAVAAQLREQFSFAPEAMPLIGLCGLVVNRENMNALFKGFRTIFNQAFQGTQSHYERVAMVVPSNTSEEVYAWLGSNTRFREWIGDRVVQNLKTHSFTIKNKSYENTVGVDRDDIDDDRYGVYNPLFAQMGQDARMHPDELTFSLLAAGFDTPCYDGQYFFDTDHPVIKADGTMDTVSNSGGGSNAPWFLMDTSKMVKPIIFQKRQDYNFVALNSEDDENVFMRRQFLFGVDARVNVGYGLWQLAYGSKQTLDVNAYATARQALLGMKGDYGKPLGVNPNLLVVGPSNEKAAREILLAERTENGSTNVYRGTAELLVVPWLQ